MVKTNNRYAANIILWLQESTLSTVPYYEGILIFINHLRNFLLKWIFAVLGHELSDRHLLSSVLYLFCLGGIGGSVKCRSCALWFLLDPFLSPSVSGRSVNSLSLNS